MLLYLASLIIFLFVSFNLFWKADCGLFVKIAGICLVFIISLKYEVYRFLGDFFFAPHLPRGILIGYEAAYGSLIILFFLLLLWDIYLAGNWLLSKTGLPVPHTLPCGWIKAGLVMLSFGIGCFGTWQAVKVPDIRKVELTIVALPKALDGLSLVQLTDLHIGPILKQDWLKEVVAKTNAINPDFILLTGDYVDGYVSEIAHELEPLTNLQSRYGVWAVTGNHEYYWNMLEWKKIFERMNINFLENEYKTFAINGEQIVVVGIPDLAAERFGLPVPNLDKALKDAPDAVRILLSHQPRHANSYMEQIDLMLSGHTHGGQMFFLQPLIARFNSGFVNSLYSLSYSQLYVSPGTGLWNGFSCRIGAPAEITNIILRSGQ